MFGNELQEEYEESVFIYILLIIETPKSSSFSLENKFIYNNEKFSNSLMFIFPNTCTSK